MRQNVYTCGVKTILAPFDGAGVEIDRAKARVELLAAMKSKQVAVGINAGGVMIRQHVVHRVAKSVGVADVFSAV